MKDTTSNKYEKLFEDNELNTAAAATDKERNKNAPVKEVKIILNYYIIIQVLNIHTIFFDYLIIIIIN